MEWKFKQGLPIYSQIEEHMRLRIVKGIYKPGEKILSVRDLAMEAGVNPNTVQRALLELEREELLYTERTNGRFVTVDEERLKEMKKTVSAYYISELFENLKTMGLSHEDIVEAIINWPKEGSK